MLKTKILLGLSVFIGILALTSVGHAVSAQEPMSFSVTPKLTNQEIKNQGNYFVLKQTEQKVILKKVVLKNNTSKKMLVHASVVNTITNDNGLATYNIAQKADESLKHPLTEYVSLEQPNITLNPNESKTVSIKIKYPERHFKGVLSGALNFYSGYQKDDSKKSALKMRYGYALAILMQGDPLKKLEAPKLKKTDMKLINKRSTFGVTLQNTNAAYLNKMSILTKLTQVNDNSIEYSDSKKNLQFAPNTSYKNMIDLSGLKVVSGTYNLTIQIKSKQGQWNLKEKVFISKDKAYLLNKNDVLMSEKRRKAIKNILISSLGIFIVSTISLICIKKGGK